MSFWGELRRRNVVKVAVAYAIVGWLVVQVADTVLPIFEAPNWIIQVFTLFVLLGFPLALILSWAYELTPDGMKLSRSVPATESIAHTTGRKIDFAIIGALVLALGFVVVDNYVLVDTDQEAVAQQTTPTVEPATESSSPSSTVEDEREVLPNSIAVLPFRNDSPDAENAYYAPGFHDEVLDKLGKLSALIVIGRQSVQRYANTDKSIPEIARELNVEAVMDASLSYADGQIRFTTQLNDGVTGALLWGNTYIRDSADIFALQAEIATNIAIALEAAFTLAEQESIERRLTNSVEAFESYLRSRAVSVGLGGGSVEDYERKLGLIERAINLDPGFSTAWAEKSTILVDIGLWLGLDQRDAEQIRADAEDAALRAVELAPDSGVAHSALANVASWREDWVAAETQYREALAVGGEPGDYGLFLLAVGKAERARDYFLRLKEFDPLSDDIAMFIAASYDSSGEARTALEGYDRIAWVGKVVNQIITQLGTDDDLALIPQMGFEGRVFENRDSPEMALAELRELYEQVSAPIQYVIISALVARFGDEEFSLSVMEDALDWMPKQAYMLWRPVFSDVRTLPRFKDVMSERGLVDYWREYGWPDFCQPLGGEEFECN